MARAQVSEALVLASGAKTAVAEYYMVNGKWPADNEAAGLAEADEITGKYVSQVMVNSGSGGPNGNTIYVLFSSSAHKKLFTPTAGTGLGGILILEASDEGGSISWTCRADDMMGGMMGPDITPYLPSSCKP